ELVAAVRPKFEKALREKMVNLADLIPRDIIIPKGTPLNLILNLHAARVPYALKFYLKHKANERLVVEELLKLSDCPDLVENRGHPYGSELKPDDKRALIEFLKTLCPWAPTSATRGGSTPGRRISQRRGGIDPCPPNNRPSSTTSSSAPAPGAARS